MVSPALVAYRTQHIDSLAVLSVFIPGRAFLSLQPRDPLPESSHLVFFGDVPPVRPAAVRREVQRRRGRDLKSLLRAVQPLLHYWDFLIRDGPARACIILTALRSDLLRIVAPHPVVARHPVVSLPCFKLVRKLVQPRFPQETRGRRWRPRARRRMRLENMCDRAVFACSGNFSCALPIAISDAEVRSVREESRDNLDAPESDRLDQRGAAPIVHRVNFRAAFGQKGQHTVYVAKSCGGPKRSVAAGVSRFYVRSRPDQHAQGFEVAVPRGENQRRAPALCRAL